MSAAAKTAEPVPDQLELYRLRDDLANSYNPRNAHERMLVTQIAQAWIRLERAYDAEKRYFQGRGLVEIIAAKLDEFKAITRYVTGCERAWRHATLNLEKSQRRARSENLRVPNRRPNPPGNYPQKTSAPAADTPAELAIEYSRRE